MKTTEIKKYVDQKREAVIEVLTGKIYATQKETAKWFTSEWTYSMTEELENIIKKIDYTLSNVGDVYELLKLKNAIHAIRIFWANADTKAKHNLIAGLND